MVLRSFGSVPCIALKTMAASSTVRAIGTNLSMLQLRAIAPYLLTRPNDGRNPVTPHSVDGETIEPNVSDPMAKGRQPALTADAEPADEPLEPRVISHGFFVLPPNQTSPCASSPNDVFAISMAPAFSRRVITVASTGNCCSR